MREVESSVVEHREDPVGRVRVGRRHDDEVAPSHQVARQTLAPLDRQCVELALEQQRVLANALLGIGELSGQRLQLRRSVGGLHELPEELGVAVAQAKAILVRRAFNQAPRLVQVLREVVPEGVARRRTKRREQDRQRCEALLTVDDVGFGLRVVLYEDDASEEVGRELIDLGRPLAHERQEVGEELLSVLKLPRERPLVVRHPQHEVVAEDLLDRSLLPLDIHPRHPTDGITLLPLTPSRHRPRWSAPSSPAAPLDLDPVPCVIGHRNAVANRVDAALSADVDLGRSANEIDRVHARLCVRCRAVPGDEPEAHQGGL